MLDFIENVSVGYYVKVFPRLKTLGSLPERESQEPTGHESEGLGLFGSLPEFK
jgi:hypothetical protein